jgi:hypothetical protein
MEESHLHVESPTTHAERSLWLAQQRHPATSAQIIELSTENFLCAFLVASSGLYLFNFSRDTQLQPLFPRFRREPHRRNGITLNPEEVVFSTYSFQWHAQYLRPELCETNL